MNDPVPPWPCEPHQIPPDPPFDAWFAAVHRHHAQGEAFYLWLLQAWEAGVEHSEKQQRLLREQTRQWHACEQPPLAVPGSAPAARE